MKPEDQLLKEIVQQQKERNPEIKLTLDLNVSILDQQINVTHVEEQLRLGIQYLIDRGMLTGELDVVINRWHVTMEVIK